MKTPNISRQTLAKYCPPPSFQEKQVAIKIFSLFSCILTGIGIIDLSFDKNTNKTSAITMTVVGSAGILIALIGFIIATVKNDQKNQKVATGTQPNPTAQGSSQKQDNSV